MKLLYGVQATGNGHISRARALAPLLKQKGVEVTFLFSGRESKDFFDMEVFGDYKVKTGLTFQTKEGSLDVINTVRNVNLRQFKKDVNDLDLSQYDLIVSDFEPIVAWAAKKRDRECIGIGHQYAFSYDIPHHKNVLGSFLLKWFAPSNKRVGLHWYHFNHAILPPIIINHSALVKADPKKVLVYLPFENPKLMINTLNAVKHYDFIMHCKEIEPGKYGNVIVYSFGLESFQHNLGRCQSVLCNAGFELNSEALKLGRRILVKPLQGQMEQHSNVVVLEALELAHSATVLTAEVIEEWLETSKAVQIDYPDTAACLAQWLSEGAVEPISNVAEELWAEVDSFSANTCYDSAILN